MHARPPRFHWPLIAPRGLPPYTRMTRTLIGTGILATTAALLFWTLAMAENAGPRDGYMLVRLRTLEAQAEQIEGDYILLAGDSHAERLYLPALCGLPTLNAGLSGATLADIAPFLSAARIRPPKLTLLMAGTNDANLKRAPDTEKARAGFREHLETVLSILHWKSTRVVVSQIPPLRASGSTGFSATAIAAFDAIVEDTCRQGKCRRVQLFPADASEERNRLHAPDGIHINRLADRIRARSRDICGLANL